MKKHAHKEHEWLLAKYNTDAEDYDNRNNVQSVRFRMTITDDTCIDDVMDAAYSSIPDGLNLEAYPNLEILSIVDEDGVGIVGEDDKSKIKFLKSENAEFRVLPCAKYKLTPESILYVTLEEHGVNVGWNKTKAIFKDFMLDMEKHGYVKRRESGSED